MACTKEACQFNDNLAGFQAFGVPVIGVLRSTFLLDEQGRVERAWHNVKADGHAGSVLTQLQR